MSPLATSDAAADAMIAGIMRRYGVKVSPEEFHAAVNVTFHEFESEDYDREHADMWTSVPRQIELLVEDFLASSAAAEGLPERLRVLDIGCGTGLASDALLKTRIGPRVGAIHLLDSSPAMLRQAERRSSRWNAPVTFHEGLVDSLTGGIEFDWIVTCSVLHHIPHLNPFFQSVRDLQGPRGVFCHVQDPNGDFMADSELNDRIHRRQRAELPEWARRWTPKRVAARIVREVTGRPADDLVSRTSRVLMERKIIEMPLSAADLFAITDIHVQNDRGISIRDIQKCRPDWDLISRRTYSFFGELPSTLPASLRREEEDLIAARSPKGFHVGAVWQVRDV